VLTMVTRIGSHGTRARYLASSAMTSQEALMENLSVEQRAAAVTVRRMLYAQLTSRALGVAAQLGIPDLLAGQPLGIREISATRGTDQRTSLFGAAHGAVGVRGVRRRLGPIARDRAHRSVAVRENSRYIAIRRPGDRAGQNPARNLRRFPEVRPGA